MSAAKPMMILIAGPYRSGTNDDPSLIKRNVQEMESYALPIFRAGHIPILGEWLALPLAELAGSEALGTRHSMRSSTPSLPGCKRSVMPCFAWEELLRERMRWCEWDGAWD